MKRHFVSTISVFFLAFGGSAAAGFAVVGSGAVGSAFAESGARREMSTDRPDKTESPYTIEPGIAQVEADFLAMTRDRSFENEEIAFAMLPINFKIGITESLDIQIIEGGYVVGHDHPRTDTYGANHSGFGPSAFRVKYNLWGNDAGATAGALMPFVTFPTGSDRYGAEDYGGGVIVPMGIALDDVTSLGFMTQFNLLRNGEDTGNDFTYVNSVTLGRDLTDRWGIYGEFFSLIPEGDAAEWEGTADFGVTWAVTSDIQLDGGLNIGVTAAADDLNPFIGASWRFGIFS